jgi:hypothetical protein
MLERDRKKLHELQELLYADGQCSLLICVQAAPGELFGNGGVNEYFLQDQGGDEGVLRQDQPRLRPAGRAQ